MVDLVANSVCFDGNELFRRLIGQFLPATKQRLSDFVQWKLASFDVAANDPGPSLPFAFSFVPQLHQFRQPVVLRQLRHEALGKDSEPFLAIDQALPGGFQIRRVYGHLVRGVGCTQGFI